MADTKITKFPRHLALILDGNRRWADKHGVPRKDAIHYGIAKVKEIFLEWNSRLKKDFGIKIPQITIYALTLNNVHKRPREELEEIYSVFYFEAIKALSNPLVYKHKVRFRFGGKLDLLPQDLHDALTNLELETRKHKGYTVFIPIAYDGNEEIINAYQKAGAISNLFFTDKLPDPNEFQKHLYFPEAKPVDMLVRTGGELRLSGFLLWYIGYAELFFTKTLAPDYSYEEFVKMLREFNKRERRFGK